MADRTAAVTGSIERLRVATYNVHKCRGMDRRISVDRIVSVLRELEADVLCLQEIIDAPGGRISDQAGRIAAAFPGYTAAFGSNRSMHGGRYGNLSLSRLPMRAWRNHNLTHRKREERGVLQTDVEIGGGLVLHVFNVHLGTGYGERRFQGRRLLGPQVLGHPELNGPRLVLGDFNEWTRGLTTKLLRTTFSTVRPQHVGRFPRTYPGILPLLTLDHCYFEPPLELVKSRLWRSRTALMASDHLPLIADFTISRHRAAPGVKSAAGSASPSDKRS
jgi:endonuclease/exonuclease/phosphatase family metal-dependent hydrolase